MAKGSTIYEQLRGFSKALFSTWIYYKRFNLLFDAGEGITVSLFNKVFGVKKVFLSHGHADHIAGLVNLVNIRNLGAGDQTTELDIYYPQGNMLIEYMKSYLSQTQNELSFPIRWIPVEPEQTIAVGDKRGKIFIKVFRTYHSQKQLSIGFNIIEERSRLKQQFIGKSQQEINEAIWKLGKENVVEPYEQIIFTYGGDSRPIAPDLVQRSLFLCHEATYLVKEDDERNFQQHSIFDEVLEVAIGAKVKTLLLFHLSLRYSIDEIRNFILQKIRSFDENKVPEIIVLYGDKFYSIVDTSGYSGECDIQN